MEWVWQKDSGNHAEAINVIADFIAGPQKHLIALNAGQSVTQRFERESTSKTFKSLFAIT